MPLRSTQYVAVVTPHVNAQTLVLALTASALTARNIDAALKRARARRRG